MSFKPSTIVLLASCAVLTVVVAGCAKNPGELYEDTTIKQLIAGQPGLYEIYSTAENPIAIVISGENWSVLRQGKDMIIAGGDTLQDRITQFSGQDYSIIGRRMGQPKLWFAVDGIVQDEKLAMKIGQVAEKVFPSYEEYTSDAVSLFESADLREFDFDKERKIKKALLNKKVRITGNLISEELEGGVKRYLVESRNLFVELQPIGDNLRYFLEMEAAVGAPFVAFGELTDTAAWDDGTEDDRGSSKVIGPFQVEFLRFNKDIIVRNIM